MFLYLSPSVKDGTSFGPADLGRALSLLTRVPGAAGPHDGANGDLVTQNAAWNLLNWHLVHAGHFPLWNDLSGTGLPQFLNFESAVLSLPSLVGYLAPSSASLLVTVAVKMLIASTGAYACCRLLGTGPVAAALGGTTAMLAGSFSGWLGWAISGPEAWTGWLLAGVILAYRGRGAVGVVVLAVATAFAVYAGMPETDLLVALGLAVVMGVTGALCLALRRRLELAGIARVSAGLVAGVALSAPLWLPGLQVLAASARTKRAPSVGLPLHATALLVAQGYDGLPLKGSFWFGPSNYFESAAYLGVPAIVLAIVALTSSWRRPPIAGLGAAVLVGLLLVYRVTPSAPVQHLLGDVGLGAVVVSRMQGVLEAFVAILAAVGLDAIMRRNHEPAVRLSLLVASVLVGLVLVDLWLHVGSAVVPAGLATADRAGRIPLPSHRTLSSFRRSSLYWPSAEVASLLAAGVVLDSLGRRRHRARREARWFGGLALVAESLFLLFAGVGINSYAPNSYTVIPAVSTLHRIVGDHLLAIDGANVTCPPGPVTSPCGIRRWEAIGLYPAMNIGYGIDELAAHDPLIPARYFSAWPVAHAGQGANALNLFAPSVDTLLLAKTYGVSFVLAGPGRPSPAGMTRVATIAGMALYKVPGAARFSFDSGGAVIGLRHPGDARYRVGVRVLRTATLTVRITNVAGWHASTGDGRPLRLRPADHGAFFSVSVPAGTRVVVLHYWPDRLTMGLLLAALGLLALFAWAIACRALASRRAAAP